MIIVISSITTSTLIRSPGAIKSEQWIRDGRGPTEMLTATRIREIIQLSDGPSRKRKQKSSGSQLFPRLRPCELRLRGSRGPDVFGTFPNVDFREVGRVRALNQRDHQPPHFGGIQFVSA